MVEIYVKPGCVQCRATERELDRRKIAYTAVDLTADPDALRQVTALGYLQAPVVVAGNAHWSGFRPDLIAGLAEDPA
jgi:glutaredoxin-like protein NrdH